MKKAVVTYFYREGLKYADEFLSTVKNQTIQDFTLIVFNDNVDAAPSYFKDFGSRALIVNCSGTPLQIRFESFRYLACAGFEYIVFQDIDDRMGANRVETLCTFLEQYAIVSNDLSLMNENGTPYKHNIWSERLTDSSSFDYSFIRDKNIVGFGNSGMRKSILNAHIKFSAYPLVADWFMFYQLLFLSKEKAVFTNQCETLYRQHSDNIAGAEKQTEERLSYVIKIKKAHYAGLKEIGYNVEKELQDLDNFEKLARVDAESTNVSTRNLFWWEETNRFIK